MGMAIKKQSVFEWAWLIWFEWMANENRAYLIDLSDLGMGLAMGSFPNLGMTPATWEVCISGMGLAVWEVCISGMGLAVWEASHVGTIYAVKKCSIWDDFSWQRAWKYSIIGRGFSKTEGGRTSKFFFKNSQNSPHWDFLGGKGGVGVNSKFPKL